MLRSWPAVAVTLVLSVSALFGATLSLQTLAAQVLLPQDAAPSEGNRRAAISRPESLAVDRQEPASSGSVDTLVICPPEFRKALQPWVDHRQQQGHRLEILAPEATDVATREQIRQTAQANRGLKFVVLIGDAPEQDAWQRGHSTRQVPTHFIKAKVNVHFGSTEWIATDNWYADLDDDSVPDLAIGRITADTAQDLAVMVQKILAYEQSVDFSRWRSQVNLVAGVGGFGALTDKVIETATQQLLTAGIPTEYSTSLTHASWRSAYCPDPRLFHNTVVQRLNEGCLFWVYMGHGHRWMLDRVQTPIGEHPILDVRDTHKLRSQQRPPIAVFLACYTAAFDGEDDCLAEELLRTPDGPVAILGGTRVTMPYGMAILGTGLMEEVFQNRRATLGEVLLYAKRSLGGVAEANQGADENQVPKKDSLRSGIDAIAGVLSTTSLKEERIEHLHLFHLLGDPLLRVQQPEPIELKITGSLVAGQTITVTGNSPVDGRCHVDLVLPRGRMKQPAPARRTFPKTEKELLEFNQAYLLANNDRHISAETVVTTGRFETVLQIPDNVTGLCHVRVFVQGTNGHAMGAVDLQVQDSGVVGQSALPAGARSALRLDNAAHADRSNPLR